MIYRIKILFNNLFFNIINKFVFKIKLFYNYRFV